MPFAIGFAAFVYLLYGMPGTLASYRDAGDLVSAAYTLGIAHPPGYPVYTLCAKAFSLLVPFGNIAYRMNLFSVFCGALAAALLFVLCRRYARPWVAAAAAVVWTVSLAVTTLSRVSEMYTMAALFAVAIVLLYEKGTHRARLGAFFLLGLGMGVHPTLIFLLPLLFGKGTVPSRPGTVPVLLSFLAGTSIFLYLPLRAAFDPLINWGNPVTWRAFWRVVTRADYGGLKLHPTQSTFDWTAGGAFEQLRHFVLSLAGEITWPLLGLGLWVLWRRRQEINMWLPIVLLGPAFFLLSNLPWSEATTPAILQPYLLLVTLLWMPRAAEGLERLWSAKPWAGQAGLVLTVLMAGLSVPSFALRHDFLAYDYARNLLRVLPAQAVLYDPDDPTAFSVRALQVTENRRTDITLLAFFRTRWGYEQLRRREPDLLPPFDIPNAQALQQALWTYSAKRRPFFAELPQKLADKPYQSEGLIYRYAPKDEYNAPVGTVPTDAFKSLFRGEANLAMAVRRGPFSTAAYSDFFSKQVLGYYAAGYCNLGLAFAGAGHPEKALAYYKEALQIDPRLMAAYNNLGILAFERRDFAEAARLYQTALDLEPANAGLRHNLELAQNALSSKQNKN